MKNRLWWLAGTTAVVIFFHCCTNDPCDYGGDVGEKASEHFPAQEARAYFEQTAEDLRMVHIGCRHEHGDCGHGHGQSTKGILNEVEQAALMTPLWNDLRQTYENGKVVTLEVPLRVGGTPLKAWSPRKADGHAGSVDGSTVTMKLILQKNIETGNKRYFIATFIPDSSCYNKRKDMKTPYRFMRDRDYSGYVIISDVEGRYLASYLHRNGGRMEVGMRQRSTDENADTTDVIDRLYMSTPTLALVTRSSDSESDGNEGFGYCPFCNSISVWGVCPNGCGIEVTPSYCSVCGFLSERCVCCPICKHHPCTCFSQEGSIDVGYGGEFKCTNPGCLFQFCNGECEELDNIPTAGHSDPKPDQLTAAWNEVNLGIPWACSQMLRNLQAEGKLTIKFGRISKAGTTNVRYNTQTRQINGYVMTYDETLFGDASSLGKRMLVFHEVVHVILFDSLKWMNPNKSFKDYDNEHHEKMVKDQNINSWLKKLFPGFTEEKYEMLRYAGTEDSPVFKDELTKPEQGFYKKFLSDQGIIVDAKAK